MLNFSHPLPRIQLMVDVVIFTVRNSQLEVLLVRRQKEPFAGSYALPGGYLQEGELAEQAAIRILRDKAGVTNVYVEQLYTFDGLQRDPRGRMVSVAHFALVPEGKVLAAEGGELVPASNLLKLAFDHQDIIEYAVQRLRSKLEYTNVVYSLLPTKFTYSELQRVYEAILSRPLDKRNFQKKFNSLALIEPTSEKTSGGQHRPALLYKFKNNQREELKKFF
jgi:8-oxo-dGTP diphosphatase